MKKNNLGYLSFALILLITPEVHAATTSPTMSIFKMLMGLIIVLIAMAAVAWCAKKFLPNAQASTSTIKVVGGASVGTRERVVVLEIAGRWIVVGVSQGNVNAIANLDPLPAPTNDNQRQNSENLTTNLAEKMSTMQFSSWLNKAKSQLINR